MPVLFFTVLFAAFNRQEKQLSEPVHPQNTGAVSVTKDTSYLMLEPQLADADSVVIAWFIDPYREDSVRYPRFYTIYSITDSARLQDFGSFYTGAITDSLDKPWPCRNEGKAWIFKAGDIQQTIYFSFNKPRNNCRFIYMIHHGAIYYTEPSPAWETFIRQLKPLSKEP